MHLPLIALTALVTTLTVPRPLNTSPVSVKTVSGLIFLRPGSVKTVIGPVKAPSHRVINECEPNRYKSATQAAGMQSTDSVREESITVVCDSVRLPGTLCLPAGSAKELPLVVLVQGSGPSDRDETTGPNRPFRTIAHALARRGIATLRYDKRTFVYRDRTEAVSHAPITFDTEVTDDACAALALAAAHPAIDASRLFVLGHSLGGALLPRIVAKAETRPAGVIALAAPARNMQTLMREQLSYILKQQGGNEAMAAQAYEQMIRALPASYLADDTAYDPARAASGLRLPALYLQGGHDYQVTMTDFYLLQRALSANPQARFRFLPTLDHLMRPLPAMATPTDYVRDIPMSDEALTAIADFVLTTGAGE